jgi:predicted amidohydrolase
MLQCPIVLTVCLWLMTVVCSTCYPADEPTLSQLPTLWTTGGPRDELLPKFSSSPSGGPADAAILSATADQRDGLHGWWKRSVAVQGGRWYQFSAWRRVRGAAVPRQTAVARIFWKDAAGNAPLHDFPAQTTYREGERPRAEPEYPGDDEVSGDWVRTLGVFRCPEATTQAEIELSFRWAADATVDWSAVQLIPVDPPPARKVRVAAVHNAPAAGQTNADKCRLFAPLVEKAATLQADLVVLGETLTWYNAGKPPEDCAEPVPGPSTEYFGTLAKQHNLYIVAGLLERDQHKVYNVAVLLGPDGQLAGKYRKVALPRTEIDAGITPGNAYPVFETRFGRLGMMVCYDGFFPEVARGLSRNGAEVIAFPVWGCNPLLAAARACENHTVVVSSTYTDPKSNWMITGVFGRDGRILAKAEQQGDVVIADVELGRPAVWHSLGDFRAEVLRHRPEP